jgi:hypothetical protein
MMHDVFHCYDAWSNSVYVVDYMNALLSMPNHKLCPEIPLVLFGLLLVVVA